MGFFSKFEHKMEDAIDDLGDKLFDSPISPIQIAKKSEKQMRRNKMLGAGKQYAPTLYTVLVNANDDARLFGYYPTLAGETETYLKAKANEAGYVMDGDPLVRFIVDNDLKTGKFDVVAEAVAADIVSKLREEENQRYSENISSHQVNPVAGNNQAANFSQASKESFPFKSPENNYAPNVNNGGEVNQNAPQANPAVQYVPTPQPVPAPQAVPVPQASPAPQAVPMPQKAPMQQAANVNNPSDNQMLNNPPVSPSAKTTVFAGGFDVHAENGNAQVQAVPPAQLYDNNTGRTYTLNSACIIIGRENTCNVVLNDANVSRQHAQINYHQGLWLINDLGSTNGTFVNNQEITTRELHSGDVITIGVSRLSFQVG